MTLYSQTRYEQEQALAPEAGYPGEFRAWNFLLGLDDNGCSNQRKDFVFKKVFYYV